MKITLTYPQIDEILKLVNKEVKALEATRGEFASARTASERIYNITDNKLTDEERKTIFLNTIIETFQSIVGQVEFEVDVKLGRKEEPVKAQPIQEAVKLMDKFNA